MDLKTMPYWVKGAIIGFLISVIGIILIKTSEAFSLLYMVGHYMLLPGISFHLLFFGRWSATQFMRSTLPFTVSILVLNTSFVMMVVYLYGRVKLKEKIRPSLRAKGRLAK